MKHYHATLNNSEGTQEKNNIEMNGHWIPGPDVVPMKQPITQLSVLGSDSLSKNISRFWK